VLLARTPRTPFISLHQRDCCWFLHDFPIIQQLVKPTIAGTSVPEVRLPLGDAPSLPAIFSANPSILALSRPCLRARNPRSLTLPARGPAPHPQPSAHSQAPHPAAPLGVSPRTLRGERRDLGAARSRAAPVKPGLGLTPSLGEKIPC